MEGLVREEVEVLRLAVPQPQRQSCSSIKHELEAPFNVGAAQLMKSSRKIPLTGDIGR